MIAISKSGYEIVSASDFREFKGTNVLLSRLENNELLIRRKRGKYSLFHPLFSEFLRNQ
jgi:hypothetical protein